jgi:hypothetical protein
MHTSICICLLKVIIVINLSTIKKPIIIKMKMNNQVNIPMIVKVKNNHKLIISIFNGYKIYLWINEFIRLF